MTQSVRLAAPLAAVLLTAALTACGASATTRADPSTTTPTRTAGHLPTLSGKLTVVAGVQGKAGVPQDGPATNVRLGEPTDVATGSDGSMYIADHKHNVVVKVDPSGQSSIVLGRPGSGGAPTPGPAIQSEISIGEDPGGVVVDRSGNLYVSDSYDAVVVKVDSAGTLSIVAGRIGAHGMPTAGSATNSRLQDPRGLAVDRSGNLYIADMESSAIEKVTPAGTLSIVAGIVGHYDRPVPGPASASPLQYPVDVAVGTDGTLYIDNMADGGSPSTILRVATTGNLSIVAGDPNAADDDGTGQDITPGPAVQTPLYDIEGLAVRSDGMLYVSVWDEGYLLAVSPDGKLSTLYGSHSSAAPAQGQLDSIQPEGLAIDSHGDLLAADYANHVVLKVS